MGGKGISQRVEPPIAKPGPFLPRLAGLQAEEAGILQDLQGIEGIVILNPVAQAMKDWCFTRLLVIRTELAELVVVGGC